MKAHTLQLAKNLKLYGHNFIPKSNYRISQEFKSLSDCRMFCNRIGVRLNYTNAAYLIKHSQLGNKFRVCTDEIQKKPKVRSENLWKSFDNFNTEGILFLPFMVNCNEIQTHSLDFDAFLPKKKNKVSNPGYIKQVLPSLDDIQVMLNNNDTVLKKFNINSVFPNSASQMNARTLPCSDNIYNLNYSNNVNEINNRIQSPNPSNIGLVKVFCSPSSLKADVPSSKQDPQKSLGKPSDETLLKVSNKLTKQLQSFFTKSMDYDIYTPDIIFENRIRGKVAVGLLQYIRQMALLRIMGHIKYAFVNFEILKVTQHPIDGTIKLRWRIVGVSAIKSLPFLFTLKSYTMKDAKEKMETWFDGFSTFYVNQDGLIYKHVADKMMPDEEHLINKKPSLMSKLAALMGRTLKTPATSEPAVTTSVVDEPKDKTPSQLSQVGVKKSSFVLPLIGNEILETII